jgi:hypothetical protein
VIVAAMLVLAVKFHRVRGCIHTILIAIAEPGTLGRGTAIDQRLVWSVNLTLSGIFDLFDCFNFPFCVLLWVVLLFL